MRRPCEEQAGEAQVPLKRCATNDSRTTQQVVERPVKPAVTPVGLVHSNFC